MSSAVATKIRSLDAAMAVANKADLFACVQAIPDGHGGKDWISVVSRRRGGFPIVGESGKKSAPAAALWAALHAAKKAGAPELRHADLPRLPA